jgi:ketosteroid isomerase-like protein
MSRMIEEELITLDKEWNDAEVRGDIVTLERILADELISTWLDGSVETKAKVLESFKSGNVIFESMTCNDYVVRVYGDMAVMNHSATMKGQHNDQDFHITYGTTHVWARRGGQWQVIANQLTHIAPH